MKLFWSWQSDRPQRICRHFVKDALELAAKRVAADMELDESQRPEVDHDTLGEPGMVDIVATILRKIETSAVFIADLTPIAKTEQGKLLPNPNVLIELGYAMKTIGPERIVLIANSEWGYKPEKLPFDLRHRRGPIIYRLGREADDEAINTTKQELAKDLASALMTSLKVAIKDRVETAEVPGVASRADDPSVWFAKGEKLRYRDDLDGMMTEVDVQEGPRAYMRIIPAGWQVEKPRRAMVHRLRDLAPLGRWRSADSGVNEHGVLVTEVHDPKQDGTRLPSRTATQWFESTGEIWGFDGKAVLFNGTVSTLLVSDILRQWSEFLGRGIYLLRKLNAKSPFRVEAGTSGLNGVRWPGSFPSECVQALKVYVMHEERDAAWDPAIQVTFLTRTHNEICEAFGLPPVSEAEVSTMLGQQARRLGPGM